MRRIELQQLLPVGTVSDRTRSNALEGIVSTTLADAGASGGVGTRSDSGGWNASPADPLPGLLAGSAKDITAQLSALTSQITSLSAAQQTQTGATQDNTQAVSQNTNAKSSGSSIGGTVGSVAMSLLGGGLSLSPIISGLMKLFGGGGSQSSPAPLTRFTLPAPVQFEAGLTEGSPAQVVPVSYGRGGQARPQQASPAPQINIQVSAMDSRSFIDHSEDIARAVKEAMLNSNSLNDVIADL